MSYSDIILTDQEGSWINACCGRLRQIQADAATAEPERRLEYLHEEVDRSLKTVPEASRKRLVEALISRFPVAGQVAPSTAAPAPTPAEETPAQVLERFFAVATKLSPEERAALSERLNNSGFIQTEHNPSNCELSNELLLKLGLPAGRQPKLTRLAELAAFLVEEVCVLDKNALKTMRELSPRSSLLKRSEHFRKTVSRFLASEDETLEQQWQEIRGLLGGLLAATQGGGKDFGKQFVEHLSPNAIEDIVVGEGESRWLLGPNKKERCWDKYRDLAGDYATPDLIDRRIKDCMAAFVERLLVEKS
jgi:hypothetical protein